MLKFSELTRNKNNNRYLSKNKIHKKIHNDLHTKTIINLSNKNLSTSTISPFSHTGKTCTIGITLDTQAIQLNTPSNCQPNLLHHYQITAIYKDIQSPRRLTPWWGVGTVHTNSSKGNESHYKGTVTRQRMPKHIDV